MYCQICKELVYRGGEPLKDEEGYEYPYDEQICGQCRPKQGMTQKEVDRIIKKKHEKRNS